MRQSHGSSIPTTRRRHEILSIDGHNIRHLLSRRSVPHTCKRVLHSGEVQQPRRPSVAVSPGSRVAPVARVHQDNIREMGNPTGGPICVQQRPRSPSLCIERSERQASNSPRRFLDCLEFQSGMGVPAPISNSPSSELLKPSLRNVLGNRATLGESVLAGRSEITGISPAVHDTEPESGIGRCNYRSATPPCPRSGPGSMEMWGWSQNLSSWNNDQIKLLKDSWRVSTLRTYKPAWNRWLEWCKDGKISPDSPSGSDLARFLADLYIKYKLSYNTIMLHKSVVSTLCNVNDSGALSNHVLVRHVLKSISIKKPKSCKLPVWNIDDFVCFLAGRSINHDNIFDVSSQTAALLLLCSGRRIHDLTLLRVDTGNYVQSLDHNSVTLWPAFGSKTDSSDHRQTGWKLFKNDQNINLDPVYWVEQTVSLLAVRRQDANCHNLFVTTRGAARAASRAIIAGWIKTLMRQAGIAATPGSIRSAVASKNWLDNFSMEDILARGNWRSSNTFMRFYKRQVLDSSRSNSITTLFNPVT